MTPKNFLALCQHVANIPQQNPQVFWCMRKTIFKNKKKRNQCASQVRSSQKSPSIRASCKLLWKIYGVIQGILLSKKSIQPYSKYHLTYGRSYAHTKRQSLDFFLQFMVNSSRMAWKKSIYNLEFSKVLIWVQIWGLPTNGKATKYG